MTTKVTKTESYEDAQGKHIVTRGVLRLLRRDEVYPERGGLGYNTATKSFFVCNGINRAVDMVNDGAVIPIIISDEPIEVGDSWLNKDTNTLHKEEHLAHLANNAPSCKRVIAFLEHFSPKHLQAIVDGKLKDGDEVLIKCINSFIDGDFGNEGYYIYRIALNQSSHIKLFRVNKELTWDEVWAEWMIQAKVDNGTKSLLKFLNKNFNPPTRK